MAYMFTKISQDEASRIEQRLKPHVTSARNFKDQLTQLYGVRRGLYHGIILPGQSSTSGDTLTSGLYATIVRKFTSYFLGNGFTIKARSTDVSDEKQSKVASIANSLFDELYNKNEDFIEMSNDMAFQSGKDGDGYIDTEIVDGQPIHSHITNPEHVGIVFADDKYKDLDLVLVDRNISIRKIEKEYGITTKQQPLGYTFSTGFITTSLSGEQSRPLSETLNLKQQLTDPNLSIQPNLNMGVCTHIYDYVDDRVYVVIDGRVVGYEDGATPIYRFAANKNSGLPMGISDFEEAANNIMTFDEKLSQESDIVTQSSRLKVIAPTKNAATALQAQINWKKNQILHVADKNPAIAGGSPLEILKTNENVYNYEQFNTLMTNLIRTTSGLSELLQDTIAPNVSGRAIQQLYQSTFQVTSKKRDTLTALLHQLVLDDLYIIAKSSKSLAKELIDEETGRFNFFLDIRYGAVIPQEEQTHIQNITQLTSGTVPVISMRTARESIPDFVSDPEEEEKRILEETGVLAQRATAQNTVNNVSAPTDEAIPAGEGTQSVAGDAGTAQVGMSPESMTAMTEQQSTGSSQGA